MAKNRKNSSKTAKARSNAKKTDADENVAADSADGVVGAESFSGTFPFKSLLTAVMIGLLVVVHYGLWLGHNSVPEYVALNHEISAMQRQLDSLSDRNGALRTEVVGLKTGFAAVEARARNDLGLVKKGETFFQIIDPAAQAARVESAPPATPAQ